LAAASHLLVESDEQRLVDRDLALASLDPLLGAARCDSSETSLHAFSNTLTRRRRKHIGAGYHTGKR